MRRYMQTSKAPGAIVGVSVHRRRYFFHYGQATDNGAPFTPDTLVEIGSNTKTFTTALFALAVARGQIEAGESIQKHMPDGMKLEPLAQKATPLQLASFQSGMPDDPTNLPPRLEMRSIEHYTTKDFLTWVSHWKPVVPPPAPYLYSNSGIGLLSYLVMNATGKGWEEQLNNEIVTPLGMIDTELRPTHAQQQRLARGHLKNGNNAPVWPIFAWYAAGGLRSTARDMLSYGEANLWHSEVQGKPVPAAVTSAMQQAQAPIYPLSPPAKAHQAWHGSSLMPILQRARSQSCGKTAAPPGSPAA
jgi:CubicO group peptidase (beta-lactamase class C family)